jgi:hypothetical protein
MLEKIKARLTDDAHCWYKMWSSWLAAAWGLIVTVFWTSPDSVAHVIAGLPDEIRNLLSPVVMTVFTGLPIVVRLVKQNKLTPGQPVPPPSE